MNKASEPSATQARSVVADSAEALSGAAPAGSAARGAADTNGAVGSDGGGDDGNDDRGFSGGDGGGGDGGGESDSDGDAAVPLGPTGSALRNPCTDGRPVAYLLVGAISKRANLGAIVRSAVAFGVAHVVVVGRRDLEVAMHGAFGADRFVAVTRFARMRGAVDWLHARGVAVCGIELAPGAQPVGTHPWRGDTAFLAGNEGDGIPAAHRALCDSFVYVPQHSTGTASLNVASATAIVLHHFAAFAAYDEAGRDPSGREKYAVVAPPQRRGPVSEADFEKRAARAARAAAAATALPPAAR